MEYPSEKNIRKAIGKKVKNQRLLKGISQANLCYEIDLDISTLSRLERGELNVTLNTLYKIGKFLEVPVEAFLQDK